MEEAIGVFRHTVDEGIWCSASTRTCGWNSDRGRPRAAFGLHDPCRAGDIEAEHPLTGVRAAALQKLAPKQRAALLLMDVLQGSPPRQTADDARYIGRLC